MFVFGWIGKRYATGCRGAIVGMAVVPVCRVDQCRRDLRAKIQQPPRGPRTPEPRTPVDFLSYQRRQRGRRQIFSLAPVRKRKICLRAAVFDLQLWDVVSRVWVVVSTIGPHYIFFL